MTSVLRPRDYQRECSEALDAAHLKGVRRPAVVLPTGAGKTVVFSMRADAYLKSNPGKRVLVLAHTDELVAQAAAKVHMVAPDLRVGIVKAARNEVHAQVIVASVQSLRSSARLAQLRNVGLIIVDECHHATAPTYRKIMKYLGALPPELGEEQLYPGPEYRDGPGAIAEGFTATLARGDKAKLSDVWGDVAFRRDISFMIRRRYLLDVRGKRVEVPDFTTKGLKLQGGDFRSEELADRLTDSLAPEKVAQAYREHASDRSGLVFTPNVASAYVFAEALMAEGITAEVVHGALPMEERRLIIKRLESGDTQVLVNCMVLTEGFDSPRVSCVVVARPTKSSPLYQQMVGRGLRLFNGQTDCLVLDVVGASRQHGLASLVDLSPREDLDPDKLEQGLSLIELEDYEELEEIGPGDRALVDYWSGPVEVTDFDPLARDSKRVWKTTASGVRYLSMGKTDRKTGQQGLYVFLVPSWDPDAPAEAWSVVWCTQDGKAVREELTAAGLPAGRNVAPVPGGDMALPLSMAVVRAEMFVEDLALTQGLDPTETFSRKAAPWRRRPGPSDPQAKVCRNLGIPLPDYEADPFAPRLTQGEVSDMIDNVVAARQIDHWVSFLNSRS